VSEVEERVIEAARLATRLNGGKILIGPGDDMALVGVGGKGVLAAADQLVEGVHFVPGTPLALVAHKAVARNLSDVAAMAGIPLATLACATLPADMSGDLAEDLLRAIAECAMRGGAPLVGGDTCVHRIDHGPLTLAVTILAQVREDGRIIRRDGAREGDRIIVSGPLGGSFGADGLGRHLRFEPRVFEAHALVDACGDGVHAMIDVSDGLGVDMARVMRASSQAQGVSLGARIDARCVPRTKGASIASALADGEDHELIATLAADSRVPPSWIEIGRVTPTAPSAAGTVTLELDGELLDVSKKGWSHGAH
jgi:thiamine-monophosphate kinase